MAEMVNILQSYISVMINERLTDISRKPNAPFIGASFQPGGGFGICPTLDIVAGQVMTQEGKIVEGYKALLTEMERMRRYGFTEGEWERAKNNMLSSIESKYNSRDDREHAEFAEACIANFREGTPLYDAEAEYQLDKQLIELISCQMINATVQKLYDPAKNAVITVNSPAKEGLAIPTEAELAFVYILISKYK